MNLRIDAQNKIKVIPVLVYSRVSGYFNPTANFNRGKKEEFSERKYLNFERLNDAQSNSISGLQRD